MKKLLARLRGRREPMVGDVPAASSTMLETGARAYRAASAAPLGRSDAWRAARVWEAMEQVRLYEASVGEWPVKTSGVVVSNGRVIVTERYE